MDLLKFFSSVSFILFLFTSVSYAALSSEETLNYYTFRIDNDSNTNKIYYEINYLDNLPIDNFKVDIYYNNILKDTCEKDLEYDVTLISEKIMCDVDKLGGGNYKFIATVYSNGEIIKSITNVETLEGNQVYVFKNINSTIEFKSIGNKTLVIIEVKENLQNFKLLNMIPKEVIEDLNEKNKNDLIKSDLNYEILNSDPLIAWDVDKSPTKINYTINKRVSIQDQKNFSIEIKQESVFTKFRWIIYILILIIIILALKPAFKK